MSFDPNYFGELAVSPLDPRFQEQISICRFDGQNEALWTGTESGYIYNLHIPDLQRYASWRLHPRQERVIDMAVLGDGMLSACSTHLTWNLCGGIPKAVVKAPEEEEIQCCALSPHGRSRVLAGLSGGGVSSYDLSTKQLISQAEGGGDGVVALVSPLDRGQVVAGTSCGRVCLLDPRMAQKVGMGMLAHGGGLTALDGRGELVASCGLSLRMGQVVVDNMVKVYDVRSTLRPLVVVHTSAPSLLRFHPHLPGTLLVASPSGMLSLVDAQSGSLMSTFQVQTGGDPLTALDISPSGEAVALCSTSYVHLWACIPTPCVHHPPAPLEVPPYPPPKPAMPRREEDSFAAVQQYYCEDKWLLSDVEPSLPVRVGLPPRILDHSILNVMKQPGFQGHVPNPHFKRGQPHGAATAAVALLRNSRLQLRTPKHDAAAAKAERAKQRAAAGGVVLPARYRRVEIKVQSGLRFEEFDFSRYNSTAFAGLENNLPNCYSNSLLQALYFIPLFRELVLGRPPDAALEFCLADEMSFLFRMLASAQGIPCQAANLLRALKQIPEAGALGLLEGAVGWEGWGGHKGEGKREGAVARRIGSLSRFLLDHLSKEATAATKAKAAAVASGGPKAGDVAHEVFALTYRQRTECVNTAGAQRLRESHSFQVDLHFPPPPKSRPASSPSDTSPGATLPPLPPLPPEERPPFCQLVRKSLLAENETRAWFDEQRGYQFVRQSRVPLTLPTTLVVNTAMQDPSDVRYMQPLGAPGLEDPPEGRPWVPWALRVESRPDTWQVEVEQASTASELLQGQAPAEGAVRKVYELTGVVCHVRDLDDVEGGGGASTPQEGHLLAHIKVAPPYFSEQAHHHLASSQPHLAEPPPLPPPATPSPLVNAVAPAKPPTEDQYLLQPTPTPTPTPAPGSSPPALSSTLTITPTGGLTLNLQPHHSKPTDTAPPPTSRTPTPQPQSTPDLPDLPDDIYEDHVRGEGDGGCLQGGGWVVFNDFTIQPCPPREVLQLYANQKLPCLLYYTQVEEVARSAALDFKPPVPVMTAAAFHALCSAPPLQGRALPRPFVPLDPHSETPRRGMLFGIDAEFVALSAPEKVLGEHGEDIQLKQSMLSLARVSVLRGEGPRSGMPCIDDYVRAVEPVYDHLTRFSGLQPGDLELATSKKHLVSLKAAYLKLRYLVDAGCCFVGHGLKKDFRIINIIVPPHQILDTVEIWNLPRQRKLSLRFLASYLLGMGIQEHTHDSIEDARAALKLYELHLQLQANGTFQDKVAEVYQWGKMYGWDPVVHVEGLPTPMPAAPS